MPDYHRIGKVVSRQPFFLQKEDREMKKYIVIMFGFMIVGLGCALTIKANVGMGPWDAFAKSFSDIIGIEVGTAGIIFNCMCVIGQLILLRKNFTLQHLLQVPFCMVLGVIVNFTASSLFTIEVTSFWQGVILYLIANMICALGVSMVMLINKVTMALEGFCMVLSRIFPLEFHKVRQLADVISIAGVIILTILFSIPLSLGIGTILGMLIFGPTLGIFMKLLHPIFLKLHLIDALVEKQFERP